MPKAEWLYLEHPKTGRRVAVRPKDFESKVVTADGQTYKDLGYKPQYTELGPYEAPKSSSRTSSSAGAAETKTDEKK